MAEVITEVGQPTPDFELFINGNKFTHFTRGFVKASLEQSASQFEFSYTDLRENLDDPWPIEAGDKCQIKLAGQLLLTGFIDDIAVQYDSERLELTARGRSTLGDLVDSSAVFKAGRWRDATLLQIATDLCKPFSISVEVDRTEDADKQFKRFAIDTGESAIECISRAARTRGLHPVSTPDGKLRLMTAGTQVINDFQIEYGVNVIRGNRLDSHISRHSAYFLKGQSPSDDEENKRTTSQEEAEAFDDQIERYRPLLLVGTSSKGRGALKRRAIWERNRRAGQGERLIYRVDGYGYGTVDFQLWEPGPLVFIKDPRLHVNGQMLLAACAFTFAAEGDEGGRVTDLTFLRKEAFSLVENYPRRARSQPLPEVDPQSYFLYGSTRSPFSDTEVALARQEALREIGGSRALESARAESNRRDALAIARNKNK